MFMSIIRSQEAELFNNHKKYLKGKILDFGCGDGFFAEIVFGKKRIDAGLDIENSRAVTAKKNKIYKKIVYYDGEKIPFSKAYFSTVISNCVLEHIPNLNQSLKEIKRVLKPGGYFITSVMTDKWEDYLVGRKILGKKYLQIMRKKQEHYNLLTVKQWNNIFNKIGLKTIKSIPYMSRKQSAIMDIFHYLSIPSLISYKLLRKWVIFPDWYKYLVIDKFIKKILSENKPRNGAALFFCLQNNPVSK